MRIAGKETSISELLGRVHRKDNYKVRVYFDGSGEHHPEIISDFAFLCNCIESPSMKRRNYSYKDYFFDREDDAKRFERWTDALKGIELTFLVPT